MKDSTISIISALLATILVAFLFGWFVMLLWNWLMPVIFGLTTIGYWQAWGLLMLGGFLFKNAGTHNKKD